MNDDTNNRRRISEKVRARFREIDADTLAALRADMADTDPEVAHKAIALWSAYRLGTPNPPPLSEDPATASRALPPHPAEPALRRQ